MVRVVGSGFGRTGTLSTKQALEQLGFGPCHHMEEVLRHPSQLRWWARVARGERVDWYEVLAGYRSCVDFPASTRWREILAAFPDAVVLHTVRDPDRWYESTRTTIYRTRSLVPRWLHGIPPVRTYLEIVDRLLWDGVLAGTMEDRPAAIERYEAWTEDVVASVPAERLLVFDVADGWEPLCSFLDVPVPAAPFPHANDRRTMLRRFALIRVVTRAVPAVVGLLLAATLARSCRRR